MHKGGPYVDNDGLNGLSAAGSAHPEVLKLALPTKHFTRCGLAAILSMAWLVAALAAYLAQFMDMGSQVLSLLLR
jgi:hypothetical protein